ncbi:hypothetical protein [Sphaerisporangium dianthi]|uniref:Metalloprotease n=1 Tax=Sphaerisporangium dianthi TaxID=1436120 RepID=A0ABV9CDE3_9ACTN
MAVLPLSGTAEARTITSAYPIKNAPALTDNKLYKSGVLPAFACRQGALSTANSKAAKKTLQALWACMNKAWGAYFGKAGLTFKPAKLIVLTKARRFCDDKWGKDQAGSFCDKTSTGAILIDKDYLRTREVFHFQLVARVYAYHLQRLTGISEAFEAIPYSSKKELNEQLRRSSLQSFCLAGVFLGATWKTAARKAESWRALLSVMRANGDEGKKPGPQGRGAGIARWLDKGYASRDPRSCNTWTASSKQVA